MYPNLCEFRPLQKFGIITNGIINDEDEAKLLPFFPMKTIRALFNDNLMAEPEILVDIGNSNFLRTNGQWTCYRRNQIQIRCSYTLADYVDSKDLYVQVDRSYMKRVYSFGILLSTYNNAGAKVDLVVNTRKEQDEERPPAIRCVTPRTKTSDLPYHFGDLHAEGQTKSASAVKTNTSTRSLLCSALLKRSPAACKFPCDIP